MEIAAIDLGSNSFHLVVASVEPDGAFTVVEREKEMLRLGDDVARYGRISDDKIELALATISRFADLCAARGVQRINCCATSAVREAENGADVCDRIEAEVGINPRVISGTEEAELIYRAIRHSMTGAGQHLLGIDIGGGSVEIMLGDSRELHWSTSLPLGVGRLGAGLSEADPPTRKERTRLSALVAEELAEAADVIKGRKFDAAVGTSGTIEDLAKALHAIKQGAVPPQGPGLEIRRRDLVRLDDQLWQMRTAERKDIAGIDPRRIDIIHVGSTVVRVAMDCFGLSDLIVGAGALREGILLAAIADVAPEADELDRAAGRRQSVMSLMRRCAADEWHARQVARLALDLFDGLADELGAAKEERLWLEEAALLHDIGEFVAQSGHHRHSAYLIQHAALRGATAEEVNVIASIARGHRGGGPKLRHETYAALPPARQKAVDRLAAILRVADGLDRGHGQRINRLVVVPGERSVTIEIDAPMPPDLELWGARRKGDLLAGLLGRPVEIVPRGYVLHPSFRGTP